MTYLKNTEQVRAFKKELVRQFYAMRFELYKTQAAKAERKPVRASMTDAIKALPDSPVRAFKKELVRQFYAMRFELYKTQAAKAERKPVRASMTDAIKALPDSPHNRCGQV